MTFLRCNIDCNQILTKINLQSNNKHMYAEKYFCLNEKCKYYNKYSFTIDNNIIIYHSIILMKNSFDGYQIESIKDIFTNTKLHIITNKSKIEILKLNYFLPYPTSNHIEYYNKFAKRILSLKGLS